MTTGFLPDSGRYVSVQFPNRYNFIFVEISVAMQSLQQVIGKRTTRQPARLNGTLGRSAGEDHGHIGVIAKAAADCFQQVSLARLRLRHTTRQTGIGDTQLCGCFGLSKRFFDRLMRQQPLLIVQTNVVGNEAARQAMTGKVKNNAITGLRLFKER